MGTEGVRLIHLICNKIWRKGQWPDDWTESVFIPLLRKAPTRNVEIQDNLPTLTCRESHAVHSKQSPYPLHRLADITMLLCFIDYPKAFDYVRWNRMFEVFVEMGIPEHLTMLIQNLYMDGLSRMKVDRAISASFKPERGVRWGCILPSKLFNSYGEYIMRKLWMDGQVASQ